MLSKYKINFSFAFNVLNIEEFEFKVIFVFLQYELLTHRC